MSFACTLSKSGIRSFSRTLQCLHKIGSEVSIEALADKLMMRTLAPSHAAYALVVLKPDFFEPNSFLNRDTDGQLLPSQPSASEPSAAASSQFVKCKLHLKQLQLVFRHVTISQTLTSATRNERKGASESSSSSSRSFVSCVACVLPPLVSVERMELLFVGLENRLLVSFQCGGIKSKYRSAQQRARRGDETRKASERM